eukprot:g3569.t1
MEDVLFQLGIGPEEIHLHWLATAFQNTVENNALPSPWELVEYVEEEVSYYYHNTETSETSWDHPMLAMFQAEVASCRHRAKTNFLANEHFASKRRQWVWGRLKSIVVRMKRLNDRAGAWFATNINRLFSAYLNVEDLHAAKCTCQSWHALVQHFCTTVRRLFPPHFQVTRRPRGKVGTLVSTVCFFANVVHLDISRGGGRRRYNGSGIVSQEQIHDNHLIKIGKHLKALETVNLENNYSITGQGVATASKHWPMLKRVNVRGCNITRMHCFETLCTDHDRLKYVEFGPSEKRADVDSGPGRSLPAPRKFDACKVFFYCSGRLKALPDPPRLRTLILSGVRTNLVEMINVLSVLGRGLQTLDISSTFVWGESEDVRKTLKAVPCIRRVKVVNALKGRDSAVGGRKTERLH